MRTTGLWALALAGIFAACAEGGETSDTAADTTAARDTAGLAGTGSAELDFLKQMSDHHEGLVLIAERAQGVASDDSVQSAAERLHRVQQAERDTMVMMIQRLHQEQHSPQAMAKNVAQADSLAAMSDAEADRYFVQKTIGHHEEGIAMIDQHLGHLTNAEVRTMAERMRAAQQREIQELEGKLSSL
jgi:uncharacterized protein (DUF305 family)